MLKENKVCVKSVKVNKFFFISFLLNNCKVLMEIFYLCRNE